MTLLHNRKGSAAPASPASVGSSAGQGRCAATGQGLQPGTPGQGSLSCAAGLTLIELVITLAILAVLASAVLPMAEVAAKRTREIELHRALRTVRTAIDAYKTDHDRAKDEKKIITSINETGYPESLDVLLEATDWGGLFSVKKRYLRRIPRDPFDRYDQGWGLRSVEDDPDSTVWGGDNVFDIYSQSDAVGLDGTPYSSW